MLVLALAIAAGFAALSQWQLARSVSTGTVVGHLTTDDGAGHTGQTKPSGQRNHVR